MASERTKRILVETLMVGGIITLSVLAPNAMQILKFFIKDEKVDKKDLKRTIKRLSENSLISISEDDEGVATIRLLKNGKQKALKYSVDDIILEKPKKWDKKWRVVVFDVPEEQKFARNILKDKLDELGFKQIQKSIYVHPYPCEKEIEFIRSVYEVRPFVKIMLASKIEDEEKLINHFKLAPK